MSIRISDIPGAPIGYDYAGKKIMAHDLSAPVDSSTVLVDITDLLNQIGLPTQIGNNGKFLTTNGSILSWQNVNLPSSNQLLPSQTGNSGKYLTTDGTTASWSTITFPLQDINLLLPSQTGNSGKYLVTNGNISSWATIPGLSNGNKGDITVSNNGSTWTINNNSVLLSKIQTLSSLKLIGNATNSTSNAQEIYLGQGLAFQNGNQIYVPTNSTVQKTDFYINNVYSGTRKGINFVINNIAYGFNDNSTTDTFDLTLTGNPNNVSVYKNGSYIYAQPNINFIEGANINLTMNNNVSQNRIDITVAATGSSAFTLQQTLTSGSNLTSDNTITSTTGKVLTIETLGTSPRKSSLKWDPTYLELKNLGTTGLSSIINLSSSAINFTATNISSSKSSQLLFDASEITITTEAGNYTLPRTTPTTGQFLRATSVGVLDWASAVTSLTASRSSFYVCLLTLPDANSAFTLSITVLRLLT